MVQIIQSLDTDVVPDTSTKSVTKQIYIKVLLGVGKSPTSGTKRKLRLYPEITGIKPFLFLADPTDALVNWGDLVLFYSMAMDQKWIKKMARIIKRKKKNGWSYSATIRIKGCPAVGRTFDTKGEAAAWAAKTEGEIKANKFHDPRLAMQVSFGTAVDRYMRNVSSKKAINTQMREKASAARLILGEECL